MKSMDSHGTCYVCGRRLGPGDRIEINHRGLRCERPCRRPAPDDPEQRLLAAGEDLLAAESDY